MYGIQTSNKKYTTQVFKSMALQGVNRIVVAYRTDNVFTSTTCQAGLDSVAALKKLSPDVEVVSVLTFNSSQAAAPGFYKSLWAQVMEARADGFVGCDLRDQSNIITREWAASKYYLKVSRA